MVSDRDWDEYMHGVAGTKTGSLYNDLGLEVHRTNSPPNKTSIPNDIRPEHADHATRHIVCYSFFMAWAVTLHTKEWQRFFHWGDSSLAEYGAIAILSWLGVAFVLGITKSLSVAPAMIASTWLAANYFGGWWVALVASLASSAAFGGMWWPIRWWRESNDRVDQISARLSIGGGLMLALIIGWVIWQQYPLL